MGDNFWSESTCKGGVWWYGIPGQGCWYWTERYGQHFVGGGVYQKYAQAGWECGALGEPVKGYQWLSEFAADGQWFLGGAIYFKNGAWRIVFGDYGQTAGRLAEVKVEAPTSAEHPPEGEAPVEPKPRPKMTKKARA